MLSRQAVGVAARPCSNITNIFKLVAISQPLRIQMSQTSFLHSLSVFHFQFMVIYSLNCYFFNHEAELCAVLTSSHSDFPQTSETCERENISGSESQGWALASFEANKRRSQKILRLFVLLAGMWTSPTVRSYDATSQLCPSPNRTTNNDFINYLSRIRDSPSQTSSTNNGKCSMLARRYHSQLDSRKTK